MTLNDVYLVSQIVAVIMVAPTLLYLALQVRQNTLQMRANARFQWVDATGQLNAVLAGSKQVASMFRQGWEDPDTLDDDERMQLIVFMGHFLQIYSTMYEFHREKLLPDSQWHNCRKDMIAVINSPGGLWVWDTFGKQGLHPEFVTYMESLKQAQDTSFDLTSQGMKRSEK